MNMKAPQQSARQAGGSAPAQCRTHRGVACDTSGTCFVTAAALERPIVAAVIPEGCRTVVGRVCACRFSAYRLLSSHETEVVTRSRQQGSERHLDGSAFNGPYGDPPCGGKMDDPRPDPLGLLSRTAGTSMFGLFIARLIDARPAPIKERLFRHEEATPWPALAHINLAVGKPDIQAGRRPRCG